MIMDPVMRISGSVSTPAAGFVTGLRAVLAHVGRTPAELDASVSVMQGLWRSVVELSGGAYKAQNKT